MGVISPILWLDELRHRWRKGCRADHTLPLLPRWFWRYQKPTQIPAWIFLVPASGSSQGTCQRVILTLYQQENKSEVGPDLAGCPIASPLPSLGLHFLPHKPRGVDSVMSPMPAPSPTACHPVSSFTGKFGGHKTNNKDPGSDNIPRQLGCQI